ncbi:MAG: glycosyltransferase family 2 protein [Bacteroidota bacterium]
MDSKRVSVVIPTRNRYDYLKMAVDSVLSQTYEVAEIVVVDDGSDQEIVQKIKDKWKDNLTLKLHFLPESRGVAHTRNVGKTLATGDYLIFLDDDDMLQPDMVEKCLDEFGDYDVVGCRTRMISDDAGLSKKKVKRYRWAYTKEAEIYELDLRPEEHLLFHAPSIHCFMGKSALLKSMDFDESLSYGEDLDYWVRIAQKGSRFHKTDFEGVTYRKHRKNASGFALYRQKSSYYSKQIGNEELSATAKSIVRFKFGFMSIFQGRLNGILILLSAIARPVSFFRHLSFFLRYILAGYGR